MIRKIKIGRVLFLLIALVVMGAALQDGVWGEKEKQVVEVITQNETSSNGHLSEMNMEIGVLVSGVLLCGFVGCVLLAKKNGQFFWKKEQMQE